MQPKNDGYLAAMLEGEGCIYMGIQNHEYWRRGKSYSYTQAYLVISIYQTDERLMKWLVFHYGGSYCKTPKNPKPGIRIGWRWLPSPGKQLEKFLLTVLPHMLLKREQALIALEYVRLGALKTGPGSDNKVIHTKRQELARRCSLWNKRESPETNTPNDTTIQNWVSYPEHCIVNVPKIESELHSDMQSASDVNQNAKTH